LKIKLSETYLTHIEFHDFSNQNYHQKKRINDYLARRRRKKWKENSLQEFTNAPPPAGFQTFQMSLWLIDLFPAIMADLEQKMLQVSIPESYTTG